MGLIRNSIDPNQNIIKSAAAAAAAAAAEGNENQKQDVNNKSDGGRTGKNGPPKVDDQPAPVQISSLIANNKPGFENKTE